MKTLVNAIGNELENPMVELLIKLGADVNAMDEYQETALSRAIYMKIIKQ